MFSIKILRFHHSFNSFNLHNSFQVLINSRHVPPSITNSKSSIISSSISQRFIYFSTQLNQQTNAERNNSNPNENLKHKSKRALDILFKEAVGLMPKSEDSKSESEGESGELRERLRELEIELRELKGQSSMRDRNTKGKSGEREHKKKEREVKDNASQPKSLYSLFTNKSSKEDKSFTEREEMVVKEYSSEMEEFLRHLYDEGYFRNANFLPSNKFDISSFENGYACNFLKFAAEMFGKDKQEIAKWLSGSDLKTVALFGCPSLARRNVFAAKRLRTFFHISENTVCAKCNLADSCKFKNQSVWKGDTGSLNLSLVMRLLIIYAAEAVSPPLVLSDDVKACVGRLIKDAIKLSKTVR